MASLKDQAKKLGNNRLIELANAYKHMVKFQGDRIDEHRFDVLMAELERRAVLGEISRLEGGGYTLKGAQP